MNNQPAIRAHHRNLYRQTPATTEYRDSLRRRLRAATERQARATTTDDWLSDQRAIDRLAAELARVESALAA